MTVRAGGDDPDGSGTPPEGDEAARFSAMLEDSAVDLYENAPCGYLSTLMDGRIAKVNTTLLTWLGYRREDLVGRRRFTDLLTVGGRLYHETHFAPLLRMQGEIGGIALELKAADGTRMPVLVTSTVKTSDDGRPLLIRTTLFDARDRRAYETELLRARQEAEEARREADQARRAAEEAHHAVEAERERLQRLATTLQRTLLPPSLTAPAGLDVAAHYHIASADEVGGDFYDLFPLADGSWGLFLGDVCGKGAAAAAVTSLARYTLRAAAVYDPDPAAVLANLNTVLTHEYEGTDPRFCTVLFGVLTPDRGNAGFELALAAGGHPPAILLRADGGARYLPTPGGQLIGVVPDPHVATTTVRLDPGDTVLLYTDGLTEARTAPPGRTEGDGDGRYGDAALLDFTATLAPTTASAAIAALQTLLDTLGSGVDDDTALLALSVPRPSPEAKQ
ncbi:SpoIIE family protein phosphatase [Streptomyces sp. CB03911]|uniref:PP2C family protein-serine/threonine phosphatase n=1 Tax=Streptomyces sp. CB03911 TaxID=1804758 RepID=UPI00093C99CE|nr:SpoIIE family protein phosphatase [Streptomyces sp. CB03911]OKI25655.1 histidine kinase [Streptomyces sp. CB03911]